MGTASKVNQNVSSLVRSWLSMGVAFTLTAAVCSDGFAQSQELMELRALADDPTLVPLGPQAPQTESSLAVPPSETDAASRLQPGRTDTTVPGYGQNSEALGLGSAVGLSDLRTDEFKQDKWTEFKRNFSAFLFNLSSSRMDNFNQTGSSRLETYNYVSINYRISRQERLSFRPVFTVRSAGPGFNGRFEPSETGWGDSYLQFTHFGLKPLPFNMTYITHFRAYLPTSESSQNRGLITQLRPYIIMIAPITSKLLFAIHAQGDYYIQRRTGFLNDRRDPRGNANYGYNVFGEIVYRLNPAIGFGGSIGHDHQWNYAVPAENVAETRFEDLTTSAFVNINYGRLLTAVGVNQKRSLTRQTNDFSLFRDDETQYFARSVIRF